MLTVKSFLLVAFAASAVKAVATPEEVFEWKQLEFDWPSEEVRTNAEKEGHFVPANNLPLGVARWKDKLFVTVPRWKAGVAATLGYISLKDTTKKSPAITPYPDWIAHTLPKGNETVSDDIIVSVFRVSIDECDRLWVMDTGLADILGKPTQITQPSVIVFDLKTDKLIKKYPLKAEVVLEDSFFANIVVDVNSTKCEEAYAYLPDLGGYGLVVYSLKDNDSWRFKHNFFHFDPLQGNFNISGINFQWTDGIFGVALGPQNENGFRTAYFHAMASLNIFSVDTEILRNKTAASEKHNYFWFKLVGSKGENTQSSSTALDLQSNVLFFAELNKDAVGCWNPKVPLNPGNVGSIAEDHEKLVFINDINVDHERNLWMLSDKLPVFLYRSFNPEEVNYRILKVNIDKAIEGTVCKV